MNGSARTRAVLQKELRDYRRNKLVVGTMAVLPLVFVLGPLTSLLALGPGTSPAEVRTAVGGALLVLLVVPLLLPTIVAGYAVVGEREQGTLEPVLTTPIRPEELLVGKALAAVLPTVAITYALFALFAVVVRAAAAPQVASFVWMPTRLAAYGLFTPLLATFSIWVGLAVSARSSDVRVAQQLSALAVLPMVAFLALFSFRVVSHPFGWSLGGAALLIAMDLAGWRVVSRLFDRERLLTRYGGG